MNNKRVILGVGLTTCLAISGFVIQHRRSAALNLDDAALLAIIKNDQSQFEAYLKAGGDLNRRISIDGVNYRVEELLIKYERVSFLKYTQTPASGQPQEHRGEEDMWSQAVAKNNPEVLKALMTAHPQIKLTTKKYSQQEYNLLHLASMKCSSKVIGLLHKAGMNWNDKAKDGTTALTLAVENDCLQAMSYWKENGADFKAKDGRGFSALSLLNQKKDAALMAFAQSFQDRMPASVKVVTVTKQEVPNFYKKRQIPKDSLADRAHLIEPESRPEDANETAEYSEFSD